VNGQGSWWCISGFISDSVLENQLANIQYLSSLYFCTAKKNDVLYTDNVMKNGILEDESD
jgi:hypothetical protein